MFDPHSSQIILQAEIEYRRRLATALRRGPPVQPQPHPGLRARFARLLAHLALHLDGRSLNSVATSHAHTAGRN